MKIGSDEIILWLRKNQIAEKVDNKTLGRKIHDIIISFNGKLIIENDPVFWSIRDDDEKINGGCQKFCVNGFPS